MTEQVFVAREQELFQLQTFLAGALAGQGQVVFVTGEAGAGKTALVTEFTRRAEDAHADLLVALGNCNAQTGIGDPYLPFREVLGLLTGDVEAGLAQGDITQENAGRLRDFLRLSGQALVDLGPDLIEIFVPGVALATRAGAFVAGSVGWLDRLDELMERKALRRAQDVAAGAGSSGPDQSRIFEQYTQVLQALAAQQPLLVVMDDLHWADTSSISLLFHLGRRMGESRILMVGTYRPEDVALGRAGGRHPLEDVISEFKRYYGDVWVDLGQAAQAEGQQFVDALLDTNPNRLREAFRQALFRHTDGHPLFTVELLRDMRERGDLLQDSGGRWVEAPTVAWDTMPARAEGVIERRIGRLEEALREALTVASVEGEDFTAQVVARVQEIRERQLLHELSQVLEKRHRLVRAGKAAPPGARTGRGRGWSSAPVALPVCPYPVSAVCVQ
jgi:predicted ATPase